MFWISLKINDCGPINNQPALIQIMVCHQTGIAYWCTNASHNLYELKLHHEQYIALYLVTSSSYGIYPLKFPVNMLAVWPFVFHMPNYNHTHSL